MHSPEDTIAAVATPLGEGGIGVLRISGAQAILTAKKIFIPAKNVDLSEVPSHTCYFGNIVIPAVKNSSFPAAAGGESMDPPPVTVGDDENSVSGNDGIIDQVVLTLFRAPHSYTGEDVVEISAHGSPLILQKILSLCLSSGARLANAGEFTERAFLHGKMDLTQAEAVAELIRAKTDKSHQAARAQLEGSLARTVRSLREKLLPLLAHIEIGLDHADEDHDFLQRDQLLATCQTLTQDIDEILASAQTGKVLREGYRVALFGRPNVGKSSLMNSLLKEDRAIVTPIAGTTRDTLEETVQLDGIPVILTDTAGLRSETSDPVEKLGIERTRASMQNADIVIGLFDGSEELTAEDKRVIAEASDKPHLWVLNKCDLPARISPETLRALNGGGQVIPLSAKTGTGIDVLIRAIAQNALSQKATASEARWLLNARHTAALERVKEALAMAVKATREESPEECIALELKTALNALGEIIGETTTEDLLGEIFSRFCVGK